MISYKIQGFEICVPLNDKQWRKLHLYHEVRFKQQLEGCGASGVSWSEIAGKCITFWAPADFDKCEYGRSFVNKIVEEIEELLGK